MRLFIIIILLFFGYDVPSAMSQQTVQPPKIILKTAYQKLAPNFIDLGNKQTTGLCYEIMTEVFNRSSQLYFTSLGFTPWKRIQKQLQVGQIDLVFGMARIREDKNKYKYSQTPLYTVKHMAVVRKETKIEPKTFAELMIQAAPILSNNGSRTADFLAGSGVETYDGAGSTYTNLRKLQLKRGNSYYFYDLNILWVMKRHENTVKDLRILPYVYDSYDQYLAFRKDFPEDNFQHLSQILHSMKEDGTLEKIKNKWTVLLNL